MCRIWLKLNKQNKTKSKNKRKQDQKVQDFVKSNKNI